MLVSMQVTITPQVPDNSVGCSEVQLELSTVICCEHTNEEPKNRRMGSPASPSTPLVPR